MMKILNKETQKHFYNDSALGNVGLIYSKKNIVCWIDSNQTNLVKEIPKMLNELKENKKHNRDRDRLDPELPQADVGRRNEFLRKENYPRK